MAPEPMMIMLSGRFSRTMASREPMMVVPFSGRLGTERVTHPVLMRMFFPSSTCVVPSAAFTSTLPGAVIEASPVTGFHLVFLEKEPHAAGQAVADLAGTADDLAPVHAHAFHRHAEFLGPARHGQVRFRILQERLGGNAAPVQAGSPHPVALHARHGFPIWAARMAPTYPAGPPPMTIKSYCMNVL